MNNGCYIVLEGIDGSGKSTIAERLYNDIKAKYPDRKTIFTIHPGSTALGQHLRKLVKTPELIDPNIRIDNLSRQMLHFVDTISFHKTILEPELAKGSIIVSDRCTYISAVIYGLATGLSMADVTNLFSIYPPRKADLVMVFDVDWNTAKQRMVTRMKEDFFDNQKDEFFQKISQYYHEITKPSLEQAVLYNQIVSLSNLKLLDSNRDIETVYNEVIPLTDRVLRNKGILS